MSLQRASTAFPFFSFETWGTVSRSQRSVTQTGVQTDARRDSFGRLDQIQEILDHVRREHLCCEFGESFSVKESTCIRKATNRYSINLLSSSRAFSISGTVREQ